MRHKHKCDACGEVWTHDQRDDVSDDEYHRLHNCPGCGVNQRMVYFTSETEERAWEEYQRARNPFQALVYDLIDMLKATEE